MADTSRAVKITIVGGGIAGLTAALRLAQRGCKVTVYEKTALAGGNMGGYKGHLGEYRGGYEKDENYHDVYPHMFAHWYNNFWKLAEDFGLSRERDFEPMPTAAFLEAGDFPNFKLMTNNGDLASFVRNLTAGVLPLPDMLLWAYSIVDLLSQDFGRGLLGQQTVNGFLTSRPYATEKMAELHEIAIANIWSVDSYLISALAYQRLAKYQLRQPKPQFWVVRGNAHEQIFEPLTRELDRLGCTVNTETTVTGVTVLDGKVEKISYIRKGHPETTESVDNLILAVPPKTLADLVRREVPESFRKEEDIKGKPIVSVLPQLTQLRRIRSEPIPVLYVPFLRVLPNIPRYHVALMGSNYKLTFVAIPPATSHTDKTVLSVAVSDFYSLPDDQNEMQDQAVIYLILKELRRYVPFNLGDHWGDPSGDVDWENSFLNLNARHPLFINEVGIELWCPEASYPEISNLYFAGDFCKNRIMITTVEAAVVSELEAAKALCLKERIGGPIEIIEPDSYAQSLMACGKLLWRPSRLVRNAGPFHTTVWTK
jgi:phytoene dehydrogenase-like protein